MGLGKKKVIYESFKHKRERFADGLKSVCKNAWSVLRERRKEGDDHFKGFHALIFPLAALIITLLVIYLIANQPAPETIPNVNVTMNDSINVSSENETMQVPVQIETENKTNRSAEKRHSFLHVVENIQSLENQVINVTGHLSYELINGEYMRLIVDDYGNKLKLTFYTDFDKDLFQLNNVTDEYYFVIGKFRSKYPVDAIDVYDINYVYDSGLGGPCKENTDCKTPIEYLVQSNCPFASACIEGTCKVICPFTFHDPDPNVNKSYPVPCKEDYDCDCSIRGDRWIDCLCLEGGCVSVEAE